MNNVFVFLRNVLGYRHNSQGLNRHYMGNKFCLLIQITFHTNPQQTREEIGKNGFSTVVQLL